MPAGHLGGEGTKSVYTELVRRRKGGTGSLGGNFCHRAAYRIFAFPDIQDSRRKTVHKTQIWASFVLLLTELLFPFSFPNVGVSVDLLTLLSYIRTIKLAGRRCEEQGSGSQMALPKRKS